MSGDAGRSHTGGPGAQEPATAGSPTPGRPDPAGFDEQYYADVTRTARAPRFGSHWWSQRFFARRIRRALARCGGSRVLELGCAHGHVLRFVEPHAQTAGIDISAHAVAAARRIAPRSRTVVGNVERDLERLFEPGSFDVVFAKSLLEHLARPEDVLRGVHRLLREEGVLIFSVPNTDSLLRPLKGERWIGHRDPTHVSLWSPGEWSARLRSAGFEIERRYSNGFWDVPYLPFLPNPLQFLLFAWPTVLVLLTGGTFWPVRLGENLIIEARRRG